MRSRHSSPPPLPTLAVAAALALGAAVSLGLGRFSYALLLPTMRADLGWSYLTAGAMNTLNAAGYLLGALLAPRWLARFGARRTFLAGCAATGALLLLHGAVLADAALYALRLLTGVASAATFVAGGLLAARLNHAAASASPAAPQPSAALVLGIYYGGTGAGIVASSLLVPPLAGLGVAHAWQWAWVGLGAAALGATALSAWATHGLAEPAASGAARAGFRWTQFACSLTAYLLFGLGYIGYMTFNITLLREQHLSGALVTGFFVLLGLSVMASSWVWAGLLQRFRGGQPLALLSALLAAATALPVLSAHPLAVFASGVLFGGVFLSLVASTTALVRHNLPVSAWPAGIAAFTIMFAAGQIVGPSLVGWIADAFGGLRAGLALSAAVLALAAAVACGQKALPQPV